MAFKSDIEIAQECKMLPISKITEKAHVEEQYLELYGNYKAKIDPVLLRNTERENGKSEFQKFTQKIQKFFQNQKKMTEEQR